MVNENNKKIICLLLGKVFDKFWNLKKTELYNLKNEVGEFTDLAQAQPEKVRTLEAQLMAYLEKVKAEVLYPTKKKAKKSSEED